MQSAIGFDETRGDQIRSPTCSSPTGPGISPEGTVGPGLFDFTRDDLINGAEMLVTLLIALALVLLRHAPAAEARADPRDSRRWPCP